MTYTLEDAGKKAMEVVRGVSGIRAAPDNMAGSLSIYPFAFWYPGPSTWEVSPVGTGKALHTIVIEVHVARKDAPRDVEACLPFADSIPKALLADVTLGGRVQTFARVTCPGLVRLDYGSNETLGFKFSIEEVKMLTGL